MKSKKLWLGMLVSVLVFGMTVLGCDDGSSGGADPALNGIWIMGGGIEFQYNNGNWEDLWNGTPYAKGTYTTNNGEITTKSTHLWGNGGPYQLNLDAKWYTKAELQSLNIPNLESLMTDGYTRTYSINGNTIIFTDRNGITNTGTRK